MVLTDGTKYLAEEAGAFWLMDAIASHQPKCLKEKMLQEIQFWTLKVNRKKGTAVLECRKDSGYPPTVTQKFPYTDFPLDEVELYVEPLDETNYVILLPSEH
jgi:hypothetical protein